MLRYSTNPDALIPLIKNNEHIRHPVVWWNPVAAQDYGSCCFCLGNSGRNVQRLGNVLKVPYCRKWDWLFYVIKLVCVILWLILWRYQLAQSTERCTQPVLVCNYTFIPAVRTSVGLWCHNYAVTALSNVLSTATGCKKNTSRANVRTPWLVPALSPCELTEQTGLSGRGDLKRREPKWNVSDSNGQNENK